MKSRKWIGCLFLMAILSSAWIGFTSDAFASEKPQDIVMSDDTLSLYPKSRTEKEYAVPEGILRIGEYAFEGNSYIEKVILPDSVQFIDCGAFSHCPNLHEVVLSKNLLVIGEMAFYECFALRQASLTGLDKLIVIGNQSFCNTDLSGEIHLPPNVFYLGDSAFVGVVDITDLYLPNSLYYVPQVFWLGWDHMTEEDYHMTIHIQSKISSGVERYLVMEYSELYSIEYFDD